MSQQHAEKERRDLQVFSAREALVELKAKLSVAALTKTDVKLSATEARIALALMDEKTPWSF